MTVLAVSLDRVDRLVSAGPLLLALLVSALAGLVSFASPCVVPLVPGYLSYLAAVVGVEDGDASAVTVRTARLRGASGRRRCSWPGSPSCSCSARSRCSG